MAEIKLHVPETFVVVTDEHTDVDGFPCIFTTVSGVYSKKSKADEQARLFNERHTRRDDAYMVARVEIWATDADLDTGCIERGYRD